jgi:aspartate aminotransferase
MFEEGAQLKARYGAENVFDFSIGNPDVPPPPAFKEALLRLVNEDRPGLHGYPPNAGWPEVREKVAAYLTSTLGRGLKNSFTAGHVLMSAGAAGALNCAFKALMDPGQEIVTPRPYFMEYEAYADNHGLTVAAADSGPGFTLDVRAIAEAVTPRTGAVLINSPHNPTGVVYRAEELAALGALLAKASQGRERPLFLIADEPYRKLAYGGVTVPSVFPHYPYSIVCTSYSKDLSVPGERVGYAALNPDMPDSRPLFEAMAGINRVLGYVSAPSLVQLAVAELQGVSVDIGLYEQRRDLFVAGLRKIGYDLAVPDGAFYLFPKSPIEDDWAFVSLLKEEKILTAPGSLFGQPGYFRICYCAPTASIAGSFPGFARALEKAGG